MTRVHIPPIFPRNLSEQLEDAVHALPSLTLTTLTSADYIVLNNVHHLHVALPADLLRNIAWFCSGYRRPQAGIAVTSDWLIDSLKRGRILPVWGYQIPVVWHLVADVGEAWMEWRDARGWPIARGQVGEGVGADKVETRDGSSDLGGFDKVVDREETLATAQGRIPIVHNVKGSSTSTQVTTLQASDTRATVASTGRQAPSVKARPSKIKRAKPHRARHAIPPSKTTKAPIKRSISDLTNILNLKAPSRAETAPAGAANKKKRQRQREEIREEDNPALDKLIRIIAFAIDDKLKPVKSLGRLCEDLDQQDPHPRGIQWRSFYRSYELFILHRVPGLAAWLQSWSLSTSKERDRL